MRIFKSLIGVIIAIILFWIIFTLSYWVLGLLESLRSWTWVHQGGFLRTLSKIFVGSQAYPSEYIIGSKLQRFFINLMATGIGAYLAMIGVDKILRTYSKKFVLYGFSAVLILFTMYALILMISVAKQAGFEVYDFSIQILTPIVAIVTAYFTTERLAFLDR